MDVDMYDYRWCEALIEPPYWWYGPWERCPWRQCSRGARLPNPELADAVLCWQHEHCAERHGAVLLTGDRILLVDVQRSSADSRDLINDAQIRHIVGAGDLVDEICSTLFLRSRLEKRLLFDLVDEMFGSSPILSSNDVELMRMRDPERFRRIEEIKSNYWAAMRS